MGWIEVTIENVPNKDLRKTEGQINDFLDNLMLENDDVELVITCYEEEEE
jgi:DNA-binding phage protein